MDLFDGQTLTGKIQRHALAGMGFARFTVLCVQTTDAHAFAGGAEQQFIADSHAPGKGGTGDHHTGAGDAEGAINGQAELAAVAACGGAGGFVDQRGAQDVDAIAANAGDREDRRAGQWPGDQQVFDLPLHVSDARRLDAVDLGQRYQCATDAEQLDDGQVLASLRHHAIVSGDHQQHAIDAAGAGQHVVYETLVARHVDKAGEAAFT